MGISLIFFTFTALGMFVFPQQVMGSLKEIREENLGQIVVSHKFDEYNCDQSNFNQISPQIKSKIMQESINEAQIEGILREIELTIGNSQFVSHIWNHQIRTSDAKLTQVTIRAVKNDNNVNVKTFMTTAVQPVPTVYGPNYDCRCERLINWLGIGGLDCSTCEDARSLNSQEIELIVRRLMTKVNEVHNNMIAD